MAQDFYDVLGMRESGGDYTQITGSHLGKYQMGKYTSLTEIGYYKDGAWTGKDGIWSQDDFFKNQAVQEKAIREYHDIVWKQIKAKNIEHYAGQTVDGHEITIAGMIAGAHLVGAGGLSQYLKSGGDTVPGDALGTKIVEYLELLKNCTTKFDGDYTSGDNTFQGGHGIDIFSGGKGNDTYNVGNGDTVNDSDHKGTVNFEGTTLSGGEWDKDKGAYIGDGGSYTLSGNTLKFTKGASTLTIQNYDQKEQSLGIVLGKKIQITISDATANEKDGTITFTININKELDKDFTFNVSTIDGSATGNEDYMTSRRNK